MFGNERKDRAMKRKEISFTFEEMLELVEMWEAVALGEKNVEAVEVAEHYEKEVEVDS